MKEPVVGPGLREKIRKNVLKNYNTEFKKIYILRSMQLMYL